MYYLNVLVSMASNYTLTCYIMVLIHFQLLYYHDLMIFCIRSTNFQLICNICHFTLNKSFYFYWKKGAKFEKAKDDEMDELQGRQNPTYNTYTSDQKTVEGHSSSLSGKSTKFDIILSFRYF